MDCNSVHLLTALATASSFASLLALAKDPMLKRAFLALCAWSKIAADGSNSTKFHITETDYIENIAIVSLFRNMPYKAKNIPQNNDKITCKQRLPIILAKEV